MKAIIIYKGKHGATKQYAQWLGDDLQMPVVSEAVFSSDTLNAYDLVIIGGSVYAGQWQMHSWVVKHAALLKAKKVVFFLVCATPASDVKTLTDLGRQNIPAELFNTCPVFYLHGRLMLNSLSWSEKLLLRIGVWLTKDPVKKREMVTDFEDVKKEHLADMIKVIQHEIDAK